MDELTGLQYAFVIEYTKDFNGTRAAQRAGYEGDDNTLAATASRLLRIDKIRAAIKEILRTRAMSGEEVLARLADTARFDPTDYFIKKRNKIFINLDAIKADGMGHLIKEISYDRKGNLVVKFDDRQGALDKLGRVHGLFKETTTNLNLDLGSLSDVQLQRIAAGEDPLQVVATTESGG